MPSGSNLVIVPQVDSGTSNREMYSTVGASFVESQVRTTPSGGGEETGNLWVYWTTEDGFTNHGWNLGTGVKTPLDIYSQRTGKELNENNIAEYIAVNQNLDAVFTEWNAALADMGTNYWQLLDPFERAIRGCTAMV